MIEYMNGSGPSLPQSSNIKPESSPTGLYSLLIFLGLIVLFAWVMIILNYFNIISLSSISPTLSVLPQKADIVGQVGDKRITTKDLVKEIKLVWGVYAEQQEQDEQSQQNALKKITEREIIEQEAKKLGISVSDDEINARESELISQAGGIETYNNIIASNGWTPQEQRNKVKDIILKEKLTDKVVAWRLVEKVSGFRSPELKDYETQKANLRQSLEEVLKLMSTGASAKDAYEQVKNTFGTDPFIVLAEQEKVNRGDGWAVEFTQALFNTHKGEITQVVETRGGSMMVAKILDENDTPYESYDQWFTEVKNAYTQ